MNKPTPRRDLLRQTQTQTWAHEIIMMNGSVSWGELGASLGTNAKPAAIGERETEKWDIRLSERDIGASWDRGSRDETREE